MADGGAEEEEDKKHVTGGMVALGAGEDGKVAGTESSSEYHMQTRTYTHGHVTRTHT